MKWKAGVIPGRLWLMWEKLCAKPADINKWALLEQYTANTMAHKIASDAL